MTDAPDNSIGEALFEHLEERDDIRVAEERLNDVRAGRTNTVTLDAIERESALRD